jgi:dipeptidyl aminopeptidase/acylaminoacyl peptidase
MTNQRTTSYLFLVLTLSASFALGQSPYKLPPREVVEILDAPPTPLVLTSPRNDAMLLVDYRPHPSIELVAQPFLRLAGLRINAEIGSRQRLRQNTRLSIKWLQTGKTVIIEAPADGRIGVPRWSHDGTRIAFTHDLSDGVELWVADAATGKAKAIANLRVNDVLSAPFEWMADSTQLKVMQVPPNRGRMPETPRVPFGPNVEETQGKISKMPTFQDLLRTPHDEALFEHFATTQIAVVNAISGAVQPIGTPAILAGADFSPDEKYLLVTKLRRPFSYRVPYSYFTRSTEVWDASGKRVATVADLPISDEVPTQGVPKGPRSVLWQTLHGAKLLWVEALDEGDPMKKVPHRDKLMSQSTPFTESPAEVMRFQHRFSGFEWSPRRDEVLASEYDRDRRWRTTAFLDLSNPAATRRVIFDLSANDAYKDPGQPVYETRPNGESVFLQEGDWMFLEAQGASEAGARPRLDRFNLRTLAAETIFKSPEKAYEQFTCFYSNGRSNIVTRYESATEPPNYFLTDLGTMERKALTEFKDPAPQLTGLKKELVRYKRADGVDLSATLYLPPDYQPGEKRPALVWAYPLEYSDPATGGQVRDSPYTFTFFRAASPLFFLTQGYVVLMNATMPVIGDPETMNNTYIEQIVNAGRAAVDKLDSMGVADRNRVCVSGHSYGAFMTANLLAHSDYFAAGIARSGAYNRSLTPFGFQSERRSFWEAPELYMKVSPFSYANKINEPLLLIHGEADNNPGTFTIQSERFYQALKGNGATARLVLLPHESHGYVARESVLHTLAEMLEWADKYVKNRKPVPAATPSP